MEGEFVSSTMWKRLIVWEEDVKNLHNGFVRLGSIDLQHEVVHVSHILHPRTSEQVGFLNVLIGRHSELLYTL